MKQISILFLVAICGSWILRGQDAPSLDLAYAAWIEECRKIEHDLQGHHMGGLNHYILNPEFRSLVSAYKRDPDRLLRVMTDFTEGKSPNPKFDIQLWYALDDVFSFDERLPKTWATTINDPDGVECADSSPKARRYVRCLLAGIEQKGRQKPNKPLQGTEAKVPSSLTESEALRP